MLTPERERALQEAVERQLEIEAKARAWDRMQEFYKRGGFPTDQDREVLEVMDYFVHSARNPSTS